MGIARCYEPWSAFITLMAASSKLAIFLALSIPDLQKASKPLIFGVQNGFSTTGLQMIRLSLAPNFALDCPLA